MALLLFLFNRIPGQSLIGKKFSIYKLFDVENADNNESVEYSVNPKYRLCLQQVVGKRKSKSYKDVTDYEIIEYMQKLGSNENSQDGKIYRNFIEELKTNLNQEKYQGYMFEITSVDSNKNIEICGLDYGYYLIDEITSVQGKHTAASLCMTSTVNPKAEIQIKSDYPDVIKKIYEDDKNIQWNDIGDYEIGQEIPFKYESRVPNMNGYSTYYFAFHDRMNPALTLDENSIQVHIKDSKKDYKVKSNEYNFSKDKNSTFKIEFLDLKKIINREFKNVYGQKIIVTYKGFLNDQARIQTGRPGFENQVRLEYSNNPDTDGKGTTGLTPWDTVVCFTYQLDGLKINEKDKKLQGAEFLLYRDKECKDKIFVKKIEDEYVIMRSDSLNAPNSEKIKSGRNGEFKISGLDQGTYYLKEVKAPTGYRLLAEPIQVEINPTFTNQRNEYEQGEGKTSHILKKIDAMVLLPNLEKKELHTNADNGSIQLEIINKTGIKLPLTGSFYTEVFITTGIMLMLYSLWCERKK